MACPYFFPTEPLPAMYWPGKLRPPLGQLYAGMCRASEGEEFRPSRDFLIDVCNLGYPAASCARFCGKLGPDAVRFSLMADDDRVVKIAYVIERKHKSYEKGSLEYDRDSGRWSNDQMQPLLRQQVNAYLSSYFRHKAETAAMKIK